VVIEGTLACSDAQEMWKTNWLDQRSVPFPIFAEVLYKTLGEERSLQSTEYKCVHRLCAEKQESSTVEVVTLQRFGMVVSWIGAFKGPGAPWLKRLFDIMGMPWFHGDIERQDAERLLKTHAQKNSWLIRFSLTEPIWNSPLTVSKLVKKNVILHQRIYRGENGFYFYLGNEGRDQPKVFKEGDFSNLRPALFKESSLKPRKGLGNSPYCDIFLDMQQLLTCMYMPNPETNSETSSN